jgi:hypothetical protein
MGSYEISWLEHNILFVRLEDEFNEATTRRLVKALDREAARAAGPFAAIVDVRDLYNPDPLVTDHLNSALNIMRGHGQVATHVVVSRRAFSTGRLQGRDPDVRFHADLVEAQASARRALRAAV